MYMNGTIRSWIHYINLRESNGTQKEHGCGIKMQECFYQTVTRSIGGVKVGMLDEATIEVTDKHINQAYNSVNNVNHASVSPLEIAVAEKLKIDVERVEVKHDKTYIWMYDDSDYILYKYDEESYVKSI